MIVSKSLDDNKKKTYHYCLNVDNDKYTYVQYCWMITTSQN